MAQQTRLATRSEKGLLTPDNCVVALIDLQPQMLFGVSNFDRQSVINNNLVLAKAAKVFGMPVVLSTVETKAFSGNMWPQIQAVFPNQEPIERSSMNSWDDDNFVAAVQKSEKKKIVLAGLWTELERHGIHPAHFRPSQPAAREGSAWTPLALLETDETGVPRASTPTRTRAAHC